jgi:nucleotide-binding universal stress UspA family protein
MSKILVAVSSALAATRLIEPVTDVAKKMSAEVLVVHVSRPSGGQARESEEAEGESAVRTLQEGIAAHGIEVQTLLMFSDDIAKAVPVELIRNTRVPVLLFPPEYMGPI